MYGPSLARLEFPGVVKEVNVRYVGLGLTKATHEFLMLHYFAIDSAQIWDDLDSMRYLVFSHAPSRRARAFQALLISHVAPSYRRLPHPLWSSCMTLLLRLCLGVARSQLAFHLGTPHTKPTRREPLSRALAGEASTSLGAEKVAPAVAAVPITPLSSVEVWGFSAGSFVGLALLHLVVGEPLISVSGTLGALAAPPALILDVQIPSSACQTHQDLPLRAGQAVCVVPCRS